MSNKNMGKTSNIVSPTGGNRTHQTVLILTIVIIILVLALALSAYFVIRGQKIRENANQNQNINAELEAPAPLPKPTSNLILYQTGKITTIANDLITITVASIENNQAVEKSVQVKTDSKTLYYQVNLSSVPAPIAQGANVEQGSNYSIIKLTDLKVADEVKAYAADNVYGLTEFTATKIEKIIQ